jgi:hypothetical protein
VGSYRLKDQRLKSLILVSERYKRRGTSPLLAKLRTLISKFDEYDSRNPLDLFLWGAAVGAVVAVTFLIYVSYVR